MNKIGSKKSISAVLPVFIVVALIMVIVAGYYVGTVLPGSLPSPTAPVYTSYVSTLTGNYTSTYPAGQGYVSEHSNVSALVIVYIVDGASLDRENAFNPNPITISLSANATVEWKNADGVSNQIQVTSCTPTPTCSADMFKSTTMSAYSGTFTFKFNETGTYTIQSVTYPYENGTVTVGS